MTTSGRWSPNKVRKRLLENTWVFTNSGMVLMRPTSIVNTDGTASITPNGSVSFGGVSTLSLNGIFSSAYDNYMMVWRGTTSSGQNIMGRLRTGGTNSSTGYTEQRINADNLTVAAVRGAQPTYAWLHSDYAVQRSGFVTYWYGPNLAENTAWRSTSAPDYTSAYYRDICGTHSATTAYDSLSIIADGGNMTGVVSIYGLGG